MHQQPAIFENSEEAEFFAASCLVFSIFFGNFKMLWLYVYATQKNQVFLICTNPNPGPKPGNPPPSVIKKDLVVLGLIGHIKLPLPHQKPPTRGQG